MRFIASSRNSNRVLSWAPGLLKFQVIFSRSKERSYSRLLVFWLVVFLITEKLKMGIVFLCWGSSPDLAHAENALHHFAVSWYSHGKFFGVCLLLTHHHIAGLFPRLWSCIMSLFLVKCISKYFKYIFCFCFGVDWAFPPLKPLVSCWNSLSVCIYMAAS